jgi:D-alanyl-D-alanine carboxypeptidase/D-alanyl-D-alanine-endopeptidase (penicillin-binding protein 4)
MQKRSRILKISLIGLLLTAWMPVQAADTVSLARKIRSLAASSKLGKMRVGVYVYALGQNPGLVYEQHADEPFKPASNQKLVTSAAALVMLGEDFEYRTVLAVRDNDLVVIGSGDPSIGDPKLARRVDQEVTALFEVWASQLKKREFDAIQGNLIYDDSIFDHQGIPEKWRVEHPNSLNRHYTAPVAGLNFNNNCFDVFVSPGKEPGSPAEVRVIPAWVSVRNSCKTASRGEPQIYRYRVQPPGAAVTKTVSRPTDPNNPQSLPVEDPSYFFARTLQMVLAEQDIDIEGTVRQGRIRQSDGKLPDDLQLLAMHVSRPTDWLWRMNKSSQNFYAETLLKTLGAHVGQPENAPTTGTFERGRRAVEAFFAQIGIDGHECVIEDGSGLSHSNRITPRVLGEMLRHMDEHRLGKVFRESLAVPGEEGTLDSRMQSLRGSVFAKTGYIRGVSALSGYVLGKDDSRYAFVILCNDTHKAKGGTYAAKRLQDDICKALAR